MRLRRARDTPILITVDADTTPARGALAAMARAFTDPEVVSAAGVVAVRNAREAWLTRHQHVEYQRTTWVRVAWSSLGALEQVPGAFTGVRAAAFAEVGGFPTDSLTEDYELTYRLLAHGVRNGRVPMVVTVPEAVVWTVVPSTLGGFVRQRTRWFAGFLTTLARFRRLLFESPRGCVRNVAVAIEGHRRVRAAARVCVARRVAERRALGRGGPVASGGPAIGSALGMGCAVLLGRDARVSGDGAPRSHVTPSRAGRRTGYAHSRTDSRSHGCDTLRRSELTHGHCAECALGNDRARRDKQQRALFRSQSGTRF